MFRTTGTISFQLVRPFTVRPAATPTITFAVFFSTSGTSTSTHKSAPTKGYALAGSSQYDRLQFAKCWLM